MSYRNPLICFFLFLGLAACSKERKSAGAEMSSLVRVIHTLSAGEATNLMKSTALRCADSGACPASVGLFAAQAGADISTCTTFLVGEDLAVTNAHCIPSAVKLMPSLCGEKVKLIFPATENFAEESFKCKELEAISERPNDFSPDLALIRLDRPTAREPVPLGRRGIPPEGSFLAYKVNPVRGQPGVPSGELVAERCSTIGNSYLFPLYKSAGDPVFTASCHAVPGNSGAPLLGPEGEAAGILQASLQVTEAQNTAWLPYLEGESQFARMALGTNLLCLETGPLKVSPTCGPNHEEDFNRPKIKELLESSELIAETDALLQPFLQQNADFLWERAIIERHTLERIESLQPACIVNSGGSDPAISEARIPLFSVKVSFNRFLQPSAHASLIKSERQQFKFSRFDLQRVGETKVSSSSGFSWNITDCR